MRCFFTAAFQLCFRIFHQEGNQVGLKLNGTDQLLVYADDVNTTKKNTEAIIGTSTEVGLEVNTEQSKHMLLSHHQNAQ
jgi:hypothetical protein